MLLDVMGTSGHALGRALRLRDDVESVLIAGAGPVGLGLLAMSRIRFGPDVPVLVADMVPYRLDLAARLGGTPVDLGQQSLVDAVRAQLPDGADLAVDSSGKRAARQSCLSALGKRGTLVCVGHGEDLSVTVSSDLIAPERAVLGSEYFCFDELPETVELLRAHRPYLRQIITHRFPVAEIQAAFELFWTGATGKVIVTQ